MAVTEAIAPPRSVEDLHRRVHDRYEAMSRTYQQAARFLVQRPNEVAILNVKTIGERCGMHASSLVRFAQSFGFSGFRELQVLYQDRLSAASEEMAAEAGTGARRLLADLVARDIAALRALAAEADAEALTGAAELLTGADAIWLVGKQRAAPVVVLLREGLTRRRLRAAMLDAGDGMAAEAAAAMRPADVLVAAAFPPYGGDAVEIARAAATRGVPVVAITDGTLSPLARTAGFVLAAPVDDFGGPCSLAAAVAVAEALLLALDARPGELQPG